MPIYEYICSDCGKISEIIVIGSQVDLVCRFCNSDNIEKLLSAHAPASGPVKHKLPGAGDSTCCGSSPGQSSQCAGPGSCCGRDLD